MSMHDSEIQNFIVKEDNWSIILTFDVWELCVMSVLEPLDGICNRGNLRRYDSTLVRRSWYGRGHNHRVPRCVTADQPGWSAFPNDL